MKSPEMVEKFHHVRARNHGGRLVLLFVALIAGTCSVLATVNWGSYRNRGAEWFRSEEGIQRADSILNWQAEAGDWPKNLNTAAEERSGDRGRIRGTFDNGSTVGELRFLAAMVGATGEEKYRNAFDRGLKHVLAAQYPNGGWPQSFPLQSNYSRHITFNDSTMSNLMNLMHDVAGDELFSFVEAEVRDDCRRRFERGVACILKAQIVVDGRLTVWCAQHDEITLEPRGARTYEHASLSGSESAGILRLLMSLDEPASDVRRSIDGGAAWFAKSRITGIRLERRAGERVVLEDKDADPLWARFYEIDSGRPIFSGRDGVIKFNFMEIERERRNGYAWYGKWGEQVARDYKSWRERCATGESTTVDK